MNELDELWGSVLEDLVVDLRDQALELQIRSETAGRVRSFKLISSGLKRVQYETDIRGPWEYAEITAAYIEEGGTRLSLILWSEGTTLTVDAQEHELEEDGRRTRLR